MVEYIVIRENASDLAQAVCVWQFFHPPTRHGPYEVSNEGEEGGNGRKLSTMKAMKGQKAMTKGALLGELATATEMKKSDITKVLNTLTEIGTQEVKKSGKFVLPGLCMIKTRQKAKGLGWDLWRVFR